jgi:hypothetical protein
MIQVTIVPLVRFVQVDRYAIRRASFGPKIAGTELAEENRLRPIATTWYPRLVTACQR